MNQLQSLSRSNTLERVLQTYAKVTTATIAPSNTKEKPTQRTYVHQRRRERGSQQILSTSVTAHLRLHVIRQNA